MKRTRRTFAYAATVLMLSTASAMASEGSDAFKQCATCHKLTADEGRAVGPHLEGLSGATIGARDENYKYSKALRALGASGEVWTAETLRAFLKDPRSYAPGTRMNMRGITNDDKLDALVAFLLKEHPEDEMPVYEAKQEVELSAEILAIEGDPEYGEYLSSNCLTCHKSDGSDEGIPSITGWPAKDFLVAMYAYKRKVRPHPVMQMMADPLSDDEIAALAAYFGSLE